MNARWLASLVVVLLGASIILVATAAGGGPFPAAERSEPAPLPHQPAEATGAGRSESPRRVSGGRLGAPRRAAVAAARSEPSHPVSVRVLDAATGAPVVGADVWAGPPPRGPLQSAGQGRVMRPLARSALEPHLRRAGRHARSGDDGWAVLALGADAAAVIAVRDGAYGEGWIPGAAGDQARTLVVALAPDHRLSLRTVGRDGAAVPGVPLALWGRPTSAATDRSKAGDGDAALPSRRIPLGETSAPDGTLLVSHLQTLGRGLEDLVVVVDLPGADPGAVALPAVWEPEVAVQLVVQPPASLTVRVLDGRGAVRPGARVSLRAPASDRAVDALGFADRAGEVRFPTVAAEVVYQMTLSAGGQAPRQAPLDPLGPGEARRAEVVLASPVVALHGRAIDGVGRLLAHRSFVLHGSGRAACTLMGASDAAGNLRFELEARCAGRPLAAARVELLGASQQRTLVGCDVPSLTPQLGDNFLGDLVLDETPIALAGEIRGAAPPLQGVRLTVEEFADQRWSVVSALGVYPQGGQGFELRGRLARARHRLVVEAPEFAPIAPVEFWPGRRGLVLELAPGGSVLAAVAGAERVTAELVPVHTTARAVQGENPMPSRRVGVPMGDGTHSLGWHGLPAGCYTLRVFDSDEDTPAREVRGVEVQPGRVASDPRLERIELPGSGTR